MTCQGSWPSVKHEIYVMMTVIFHVHCHPHESHPSDRNNFSLRSLRSFISTIELVAQHNSKRLELNSIKWIDFFLFIEKFYWLCVTEDATHAHTQKSNEIFNGFVNLSSLSILGSKNSLAFNHAHIKSAYSWINVFFFHSLLLLLLSNWSK